MAAGAPLVHQVRGEGAGGEGEEAVDQVTRPHAEACLAPPVRAGGRPGGRGGCAGGGGG